MQKTVVITGGTKGIGRAIAEKFAAEGYNLIIAARNKRDLRQTKESIEVGFGVQCFVFEANLAIKAQTLAFADFVLQNTTSIAALINNVGVFVPDLIADDEDEILEKTVGLNVYSVFYLTKALFSALQQGQAHVFNICSVASVAAYPNAASYTISKFAMMGFSQALRLETKHLGIKVTAVLPGAVQTPSWGDVVLPADQIMPPADIAAAVWAAFSVSKSTVMEEILIRPQQG